MSEPSIITALREVKYFHGIPAEHLERLAPIASFVEFPAQRAIFKEREPAKDIFVVVSGEISLVIYTPKTGHRQLTTVSAGDLIGWSSLLTGRQRLYDTAHTLTPTTVISIDGEEMLRYCEKHPEFGFEFMKRAAAVLADRLSATRLQIIDICGGRLPQAQIESD